MASLYSLFQRGGIDIRGQGWRRLRGSSVIKDLITGLNPQAKLPTHDAKNFSIRAACCVSSPCGEACSAKKDACEDPRGSRHLDLLTVKLSGRPEAPD